MRALQYIRSSPKYLINRFFGRRFSKLYTSSLSLIRLTEVDRPKLPGPNWVRIKSLASGICGSDLASICAKGSVYFSPLTSTPFILGHEVVGSVIEAGDGVTRAKVGDRVVIEPALGCEVRGIKDYCSACKSDLYAHCENITKGLISAGIQTGYCKDTGGGWGEEFIAHNSQLHKVPETLSNDNAVLVEPFSCSLHAALADLPSDDQTVLIIGCGTIGLMLIAALRGLDAKCRILAIAKHPHQKKFAKEFGADEIIHPDKNLYSHLCDLTGTQLYQPELGKKIGIGGVDLTYDCVGSDSTLDDAIRFTGAQGRIVVVGMPSIPKTIDWTAIWYKALKVQGVYAYGWEQYQKERIRTFELAIRMMNDHKVQLESLVGAKYPIDQYKEAIQSALYTGRSKAVKTVFVLSS